MQAPGEQGAEGAWQVLGRVERPGDGRRWAHRGDQRGWSVHQELGKLGCAAGYGGDRRGWVA